MLGNSTSVMPAAFGVNGCRDVVFRHLPRWSPGDAEFADGSKSVREVHRRLVESYGALGAGGGWPSR